MGLIFVFCARKILVLWHLYLLSMFRQYMVTCDFITIVCTLVLFIIVVTLSQNVAVAMKMIKCILNTYNNDTIARNMNYETILKINITFINTL